MVVEEVEEDVEGIAISLMVMQPVTCGSMALAPSNFDAVVTATSCSVRRFQLGS